MACWVKRGSNDARAIHIFPREVIIMRIMMLSHSYPPDSGGIERHVQNLSYELVARGHDVVVVTLANNDLPPFEMDRGVRIYRIRGSIHRLSRFLFRYGRKYAPPFPDPEIITSLIHIIKKEKPQIVHAHNWMVHSFTPIKNWSKAKLVVGLHDYGLVCAKWTLMRSEKLCDGPGLKCLACASQNYGKIKGPPTVLANWMMGAGERAVVDMFLPVSSAVVAGNQLVRRNLPFKIIPEFVPDEADEGMDKNTLDEYTSLLPREGFLLFVGALVRHKGIHVLLEAYAGLANVPPLVLIGYETSDYRFPSSNALNNIHVLKNWPHEPVMAAWKQSILGIVPSIWPDPCPHVAMEAMLMGKPVIASSIGGLTDIVEDGKTGFLVPPNDPSALKETIIRLLSDSELRAAMGSAGNLRVNNFKASSVVPRIEKVYDDLIQE